MTKRTSAIASLRALPPVFDLRDAEMLLGIERTVASQYCWRWGKRNMIKPLGPRAGVFFNLIVDPEGASKRLNEAIKKLLRRPCVLIGASSLHWHCWTSQHPHSLNLAVPVSRYIRSLPEVSGAILSPRYGSWFSTVAPFLQAGPDNFDIVPPAFALVDAWLSEGKSGHQPWRPDPDDLDFLDDGFVEELLDACRIFELSDDQVLNVLETFQFS